MDGTLTPMQRFFLAFVAFFAVLFNRRFAEEVAAVRARTRAALPPAAPPAPPPMAAPPPTAAATAAAPAKPPAPARAAAPVRAPDHAEALHLLALLQRDGRLVDFLAEDVTAFSDAEIGAAARAVHEGCKKALDAYLELEPVFREAEGATVTVVAGFDPAAVRLTGNVVGAPPFKGALRHHGWKAKRAAFPPVPKQDPKIIAPAEVEL
jgi:Domain of unknown function (DUF2760)